MSVERQVEELVELLIQGTENRSLQWQATADENAFRLTSATGNVRISRSEVFDQEQMDYFTARSLCILNDKGRVVEERSPQLGAESQRFDDLFVLARRSAHQTQDVLEKIMRELRSKVPQ